MGILTQLNKSVRIESMDSERTRDLERGAAVHAVLADPVAADY